MEAKDRADGALVLSVDVLVGSLGAADGLLLVLDELNDGALSPLLELLQPLRHIALEVPIRLLGRQGEGLALD